MGGQRFTSGLLKSIDFGETWNLSYFNYPLNDVYLIDGNRSFASGSFVTDIHDWVGVSDLYLTIDAGKTWNSKFSMNGLLKKVFLLNETIGFGVGSTIRYSDFNSLIKSSRKYCPVSSMRMSDTTNPFFINIIEGFQII